MLLKHCLISIIFVISSHSSLASLIQLEIVRPASEFVTNNQKLQIDGIVSSEIPSDVLVSINTPSGIRNLAEMTNSLYSVVTDFGGSQQLKAILITPSREGEYSYGPRKVKIAFSQDGNNFTGEQTLFVPSHANEENGWITVEFPVTSTQYVRLDMIEGWQADGIVLEKIEFLNREQKVIQPRIKSISILLDLKEHNTADFSLTVLLQDGENRIVVDVLTLAEDAPEDETMKASELILLYYIPELTEKYAQEGRFVLSDGDKVSLLIPLNALNEQLKKLEIIPVHADEIPRTSYIRNLHIAQHTSPVLAYRFNVYRQGVFPAEATAFFKDQPPTLAVDGITAPEVEEIDPWLEKSIPWRSAWVTSLVPMPVSLTIDLLQPHTISKVKVYARVDGGKSFGPKRAKILVSDDKKTFTEVIEYDNFANNITDIPLPTLPTGRYVRLLIEESKQANNIQIYEVEFYDDTNAKIVRYIPSDRVVLQAPAIMRLSYEQIDLDKAVVNNEKNLAFFAWDEGVKEWQYAGGIVDTKEKTVTIQLNYLTQIALFEAAPKEMGVSWSFNPFSPNGDGIADTTRLTLKLIEEQFEKQPEIIVEIFDLSGRLLNTLIDRVPAVSQSISVVWDGKDKNGRIANIGPYIYQVRLGNQIRNGVIVVAK